MKAIKLPGINDSIVVDHIKYAESSEGSYAHIYLNSGRKLTVTKNLLQLNDQLETFIRVHRRYLINPKAVACFLRDNVKAPWHVVFNDGTYVPVTPARWRHVRKRWESFKTLNFVQ